MVTVAFYFTSVLLLMNASGVLSTPLEWAKYYISVQFHCVYYENDLTATDFHVVKYKGTTNSDDVKILITNLSNNNNLVLIFMDQSRSIYFKDPAFSFAKSLVILLKRNVCLIWPNFRKSLGPFGEAEIAEYRKHVYRAEMTGDAVINVFWSVEYLRKNLKNLIVIGYLTGTDAAAKFCGYVENRQNLLFGISEAIGLRKVQKVGMFIFTPSGNSLTRIGNTYIGPKTADYVQCICSPEMSEFGKGHSNFYFVNYKPQRYRVVSNYQSKTLPNFKTILVIENPFWPIIIATIMEKVIIIAKEGTNGEMLESPFRKLQEDEVQMGIYADKTRAGDFNVEIKNMDKLYQHVSHFIQGFVYQY